MSKPKLCPYCKKAPIKRKRTCGGIQCQYYAQLDRARKYWNDNKRKTDRHVKERALMI